MLCIIISLEGKIKLKLFRALKYKIGHLKITEFESDNIYKYFFLFILKIAGMNDKVTFQ